MVFDGKDVRSIKDHCSAAKKSLCVFEYIYFARPDSFMRRGNAPDASLRTSIPSMPIS